MWSDEEYRKRYEELSNIHVTLVKDPIAIGLSYFYEKAAEIQGYTDRVSTLLVEAIQNRSLCQEALSISQEIYARKLESLLISDDVLLMKSEQLRTAKANQSLSAELASLAQDKLAFDKAETYFKSVQFIMKNLEAASSNLTEQKFAVNSMLGVDASIRQELLAHSPKIVVNGKK
jgi:ABC-type phosphate transport system auxiliary subunit